VRSLSIKDKHEGARKPKRNGRARRNGTEESGTNARALSGEHIKRTTAHLRMKLVAAARERKSEETDKILQGCKACK
jgi:hypothetical protein